MEDITSVDKLKNAIQLLEEEQAEKLGQLKEQSLRAVEVLKPFNIIKNAVKDIVLMPHLVDNMLDTGVGLATGFLTKKIFIGSSVNLVRKLVGSLVQLGVTRAATQNSDLIKSFGKFVIHRIFTRKRLNLKKGGS